MTPKWIPRFRSARRAIREPITKFGGQPVWITKPAWPLSASEGSPLRFICQIELALVDPSIGPGLAYLFVNQPERDLIEEGYLDPDIIEPDGGENAVVVQHGQPSRFRVKPEVGPTLYLDDGSACEFSVDLSASSDPPFIPKRVAHKLPRHQQDKYFDALDGTKIGGVPLFGNNDFWPDGEMEHWRLLLQLIPSDCPFYLNLGATTGTGFAFLSRDGCSGQFLVD